MKKKIIGISISSILLVAVSALAAFGILQLIKSRNVAETGNILGVDWYSEAETEFVLTTVEELLEFANLSDFYTFEGQTIKLGADIVLNEGNAKDWAEKAPANQWIPIKQFAGTFDGQEHSISGLYMKTYESETAMFVKPDYSCTIQNVKLINSYFSTNGFSGVSSFVTGGGGKFVGLYSDAIFDHKGENVGGIASSITKQSTFEECWFDGEINITLRDCGGIIDDIGSGARVNVRHCLFSGVINSENSFDGTRTGGLIGMVQKTGALIMQDCLASGKVNPARDTYTGGAIGVSYTESQTTVHDSYVSTGTFGSAVGTANGTWTGTPLIMKEANLIGTKAYEWTSLDFDKYWTPVEGGTPILKRFAEKEVSVAGLKKAFDTSWYNSGQYNFEIKTVEQLYGLYFVSALDNFSDKVVKLGADIVLNEGNAATWEKNPPANEWYPIPKFAGTFNGQGHTISGMYVNAAGSYKGFFGQTTTTTYIKDFSIKNSLVYNSTTDLAATGSVAGELYGKMENVYSNAIVISHGSQVGGLIGRSNDNDKDGKEDKVVISNCWFDGSVALRGEKTMEAGGLVGRMVQGDLDITHCLNTGTVSSEATGTGLHIGGFIGRANGIKLNVSDSLNAGKIVCNYTVCVGSVFGRLPNATTIATITNTYTTTESYKDAIGNNSKATMKGSGVIQMSTAELSGLEPYKWILLDFDKYWVPIANSTPQLKTFSKGMSTAGVEKKYDIGWYNTTDKKFTILTQKQLYGLALLSGNNTFAGQTIELGNAMDMSSYPIWLSIGSVGNPFQGTFDGKDKVITGITQKTGTPYAGLFGYTKDATVQNVILNDCKFESTASSNAFLGSIIGGGSGKLYDSYSNATLVSSAVGVGGLVGRSTGMDIKGCWYEGDIAVDYTGKDSAQVGGLLGTGATAATTISNCLYRGTMDVAFTSVTEAQATWRSRVGGIAGGDGNAKLTVTDTICAGSVNVTWKHNAETNSTKPNKIVNTAALVGYVQHEETTYSQSVYSASTGKWSVEDSKNSGNVNGNIPETYLYGEQGYKYTDLDFTSAKKYWAARDYEVPALAKFVSGALDISKAEVPDTKWYSETASKLYISNAKELAGLSKLVLNGKTFKDKTVYLTKKIEANEIGATTIEDWKTGKSTPNNLWLPIGNASTQFKGTFDGQFHEISGLCVDTDGQYTGLFGFVDGATIKNVNIVDSLFKCTLTGYAFVGGIVGGGSGQLHDSYSSADIVSNGIVVGGLVGRSLGMDIKGCWYDGAIAIDYQPTTSKSIYAGGFIGTMDKKASTISNCLYTGDMDVKYTSPGQTGYNARVAGAVGNEEGFQLTIEDSLIAGSVDVEIINVKSDSIGKISTIVGDAKHADSKYSKNVYTTVSGQVNIVAKNKKVSIGNGNIAEEIILGADAFRYTELDFTSANKYWAARTKEIPGIAKFVDNAVDLSKVIVPDTSWYVGHESEDEFHITNEAEFYGFTKLVNQGNSFSKKIIYLDEDIDLNKIEDGTLDAWKDGTKTPEHTWMTIGRGSTPFRGTFDGQMNTITGVYFDMGTQNTGLFGYVLDATIKNLELKDSVLINSTDTQNAFLGSIVGGGRGELANIYSNNVTLKSTGIIVGGMVGRSTGFNISGCWYEGNILVDYKLSPETNIRVGGLIGKTDDGTNTITNCLYTGNIDARYTAYDGQTGYNARLGGAVGDEDGNQLTIIDTIIAGTMDLTTYDVTSDSVGQVGTVVGYASNTKTKYDYNVYTTITGTISITDTQKTSNIVGGIDPTTLYGKLGFEHTFLDFKEYWVARDNKIPALKKFVSTTEQVAVNADKLRPDTRWYDSAESTYYIGTAEELWGFNTLQNQGNVFSGKTIYLTDDIALNKVEEGTLAKWETKGADGTPDETKAPINKWTPYGNNASGMFSGTFDGQGYKISGLYVDSIRSHAGLFGSVSTSGTVRNLSLVDSYIYTNASEEGSDSVGYAYTGSIAGQCRGKLENIYSNATVETTEDRVGGIVGVANDTDSNTGVDKDVDILNCWFDGKLKMKTNNSTVGGGLVGQIMQRTINITNGLFTGEIHVEKASGDLQVGGLMGRCQNACNVNIKDCLSAGEIYTSGGTKVGSIVGSASGNRKVNNVMTYSVYDVTDTYTTEQCYKDAQNNPLAFGYIATTTTGVTESDVLKKDIETIKGTAATSVLTGLDFAKDWTVREGKVPGLKVIMDAANRFKPDVTWFDGSSKTYTITTPSQLMGVATLSDAGEDFAGITIKLGGPIVFNAVEEGTVAAWAAGTKVPMNKWTPIGMKTAFNGTFDGNNKTISGLYFSVTEANAGLFGKTGASSIVKNVRLTDSYMESDMNNAQANLGSVIGLAKGQIINSYSSVTMKCSGMVIGGIVGAADNARITSCWYAGNIEQTYVGNDTARLGGIVGASVTTNGTNLNTCLYTGNMILNFTRSGSTAGIYGARVGGLIGGDSGKTTTVDNSISAGTIRANWIGNPEITANKKFVRVCPIIGWIENASTTTNGNVYSATLVKMYEGDVDDTPNPVPEYETNKASTAGFSFITDNSISKANMVGAGASKLTKLSFSRTGNDTTSPIWYAWSGIPVPETLKDVVQ